MPSTNSKQKASSDKRWRVTSLVVILLLAVGAAFLAFPPQEKINQGLDIQGGLSVVLSAESTDGGAVTREDMEKSKTIIESRVNALGASEASVQIQGTDQILVQIPGMSDSKEALDTIGKTGVLEFARLDSFTDEDVKNRIESGDIYDTVSSQATYVSEGGTSYPLGNTEVENISVEPGTYTPLFTGDHITNVTVGKASDVSADYAVNVTLDGEAADAFAEASRALLPTNGKIVIIIDGKVNSAPAVQSEILGGQVQITGGYSLSDAKSLQTVLDSGSLPVSFQYEQSTTVGPTLGQGELQAGLFAMLLGLIIVMIYLIVFYKGFGLITTANMLIFACVYLGVLAGLSAMGAFSLSLAGIAGIILSIGMAADSSILVIERFKEELKEGRSMKAASISGVKHAIMTSIDADVVSIISALSLFFLASSSVKGFGLTLALGIICDIVVMLMFKAPVVRLLAPHVMRKAPGFWGVKYSLELGDVRTGGHNYMSPDEVKAADSERKEKASQEKERRKKAKQAAKEHDRKVAERQKEREKAEKQREKESKAAEKAAAKERKQAEKPKGEDKADEMIAAAEKEHAMADPDPEDVSDDVEAVEAEAEDGKRSAEDEVSSVYEQDGLEIAADGEGEVAEEITPAHDPDQDGGDLDSGDVEEADHSNIKEHTSEEIAKILANSGTYVPAPEKKEKAAADDSLSYSGPGDDGTSPPAPGRPQDGPAEGQPKMNRAQRRAMEKAQRSKKNIEN